MSKLMVLGGSILQLPAITKAKEMGIEVIAVDMDRSAIGATYADTFLEISTIDIDNVVKAAKQYQINGIMTLASDMPVRTVAAVASEMNLVGITPETALIATDKVRMRNCLNNHMVPIPSYYRVNSYEKLMEAIQRFDQQCIVKPVDNSGSRGVFLLRDFSNFILTKDVYEYSTMYSRSGDVVVEEYMEGPEVSVESISENGIVDIIAITDKLTTGAPRFVEMGHSEPSRFCDQLKREIETITKSAIKAIGIKDGPSHTEIIITKSGPKIVEIGARLGGDNITTHLVPLSTGVDMVKSSIQIALGLKTNMEHTLSKGSAIRYFETCEGTIADIKGVEKANEQPGIKQITILKKIGEKIHNINNSGERIGFVIAQSDTAEEAMLACEEAIHCITISMEQMV